VSTVISEWRSRVHLQRALRASFSGKVCTPLSEEEATTHTHRHLRQRRIIPVPTLPTGLHLRATVAQLMSQAITALAVVVKALAGAAGGVGLATSLTATAARLWMLAVHAAVVPAALLCEYFDANSAFAEHGGLFLRVSSHLATSGLHCDRHALNLAIVRGFCQSIFLKSCETFWLFGLVPI